MKAWQDHLLGTGAILEDGLLHFGDPAAEARAALAGEALAAPIDLGFVLVSGRDASALLQGQCTNDLRLVSATHTQLSGMCSPKGRLLATFRVLRRGDDYHLALPASMVPAVVSRLRTFVLRADARVADASEDLVGIGLIGPRAAGLAQSLLGPLPAQVDEAAGPGELTLVRLTGTHPRYLAVGPLGAARDLWAALSVEVPRIGSRAWALAEVRAGVPSVLPQTVDAFLPQMINYQVLGGVSFTKGCYTGQEVVARTQYLGKLKRRMYRARTATGAPPAPGEDVYAETAGTQPAGRVVAAVTHPEGGCEMLAVIQVEAAESDVLHLQGPAGPRLSLEALPYALEG
jgi:hypothetical protein